jgi:hypothetical protein
MRKGIILGPTLLTVFLLAIPEVVNAQFYYTEWLCEDETISGQYKYTCVGTDHDKGGAITLLSANWHTGNLVNNGLPDPGRQIQASFYRQGENYPNCWACNSSCVWGWNAVQAGSCSESKTSGHYNVQWAQSSIFTQAQLQQWDNQFGKANFFLGSYVRFLSYNTLAITYQMWNSEQVSTGNIRHELPVAYLETVLGTPKSYTGSQPFTNAPVSNLPVPSNSYLTVYPTEKWVGWFKSSGHGVALYVPDTNYNQLWRMGRLSGAPTANYMQNWGLLNLQPNTAYSTTVYIITGTVSEIRAAVYALEGH